ncbi:hypothetical protein QBC38DRAFT_280395 [Podospora fimiseda]|uniref:F-box domain-containing protein n=1 Tax=Podospora fimiseda TaxID=252190 RepID=A0AAN7GYF6_9PEZI|nr:hypothetical protein QBC38DRAFT_280395 [Podospora fimiseda]
MDLLNEAVSKYRQQGIAHLRAPGSAVEDGNGITMRLTSGIDGFSLLPAELVVSILGNCHSVKDVVALASTSQRMRQIYLENAAQVMWPVALRSFMAFDLAVLAVRVTKKATDAYHAGQLPQRKDLFPIEKMSAFRRPPAFSELKEAFALDHFAQCFLHILESNNLEELDEKNVWLKTLRCRKTDPWFHFLRRLANERIIRALYRTVIWGAVMSRAYQEPLFGAVECGLKGLVDTWTYPISGSAPLKWTGLIRRSLPLSPEDLDHLSQYPVYRFTARMAPYTRDETSEFSSLADWLLEDMIETEREEHLMQARVHHRISKRAHALPVKDQVAQVAWVAQVLKNMIVDPKGRLRAREETPLPFVRSPRSTAHTVTETPQVRKLTLILPGVYQPEEITMAAQVGDMIEIPLLDAQAPKTLFKGVRKYTSMLFVAEPTTKIPCGVLEGQSKYIAFPSLLARAIDQLPTGTGTRSQKLNVEHRPLAYILQKHLGEQRPVRYLHNITTNLTSLGEDREFDCLCAAARWYRAPRPVRQPTGEEAEETVDETEEVEQEEEEEEFMQEAEKMEPEQTLFCEDCESSGSECEH